MKPKNLNFKQQHVFLVSVLANTGFEGSEKQDCPTTIEERTVRGNSLSGFIEQGETIKIFTGYYDCHDVKKEDIIVYDYSGNEVPLIKIVKKGHRRR